MPQVSRPIVTVRVLLLILAVVPLAGAAWFATDEFSRTRTARSDVTRVTELAAQYAEIAKLRSSVLDERNWLVVARGLEELGIPTDVVTEFTGLDSAAQLAESRDRVDATVTADGLTEVADRLATLRRGSGQIDTMEAGYLELEQSLAAKGDDVLHELLDRAGDVDGGGDLIAALRMLETATKARLAMASQVTTFFSVQFPASGDIGDEVRSLTGQQVAYEAAFDRLQESAQAGSAVAGALAQVENSNAAITFRESVDAAISAAVVGNVGSGDFSSASVFSNIDQVVSGFTSGVESAESHRALVAGAAADVAAASGAATRRADGAASRAAALLVALTITTVVSVLAVSHLIASPLRRLSTRANQLRTTGNVDPGEMRGPREVRDVAAAIDEAAANLALAERQAHALALGDLDDPSLGESAPGELGASLQRAVARLTESVDEREEYRQRLAHEAAHDGLTSLPNRKASLEQLHRALSRTRRSAKSLAVLFIDLDGFKTVNDNHGHHVGDRVLQTVAERLILQIRQGDQAGRLGGDEFVVVAEPVDQAADALEIARRIRDAVAEPIVIGPATIEVNACIGIALADADSSLAADELLCDADLAVYKAKSLGQGRIELCDDDLKEEAQSSVELARSLRSAIAESELCLEYQPIVEGTTARPTALEALVRWNHPERGLVPPHEFVPFAERSELVIDIDRWVINEVARQLGTWRDDSAMGSMRMAVNVSARHFGSDRCVENILEPLQRHGADPELLIIEVTESALLLDAVDAATKLASLRAAGISIALDDFGSGYTSLAYLRQLPIDVIKIDRSFVADPHAVPFIKLIIDVGHLIGARITAEGIESSEQATMLLNLGCDSLQGFHFGRPHPDPNVARPTESVAGSTSLG